MTIFIEKKGEGYPLVLLHGWGFDHRIWLNILDTHFPFSVYLVDLPGFGQSSWCSWEEFKEELLHQLPDKFALLGWSLGGIYALKLALETPKVSHVINVASSPCFIKKDDWPGVSFEVFQGFYLELMKNPKQTLKNFLLLQTSHGKFSLPQQMPSEWALQQGLAILESCDLRVQLAEINIPACFMFGRWDSIIPRTVYSVMKKKFPQFDYLFFERSAHIPFLSEPENFINYIKNYLL